MTPIQYDDFDVLIERSGNRFEARVVNSPTGGTTAVSFVPPVSDEKLENLALKMRTVPGVRGFETDTAPDTKQIGGALFDALFHDQLLDRLRNSITRTDDRRRGLRIRLRLSDAHELWNIPWEFLYDKENRRFLCQFDTTPIVRYVDIAQPIEPLTVHGPIQMLVMISSPSDYPLLDVEKEWQQLSEVLKPLEDTGSLTVHRVPTASLAELNHTVMFGEYHVFHYIGHGGLDRQTGDGLLVLTDSSGRGQLVTGEELYVMLARSPIRLAVLNSCLGSRISAIDPYAGTAASLVHQGIPAVVAMQFEISDPAAMAFSRTLYEAIAYGWPVDMAVGSARRAILATSRSEWATPVLYLRAPDGKLLEVTKPDHAPAPGPPTGLDGSLADQVVTLTWAKVAAGLTPVSRWEIRRDGAAVGVVAKPQASDELPGPGSYEYTVVAIGEDGQRSVESAPWTTPRPPGVPTGLNGSVTDGRVDLHWDLPKAGSAEVASWEIFRDGEMVAEAMSPGATDVLPGAGSYRYVVLAVGKDGNRSTESVPWTAEVRPGRRSPWLISALALLLAALATAGIFLWAPWQPDVPEPPSPPAGLISEVDGTQINVRWDPAPPGSAPVDHWEVRRDGAIRFENVTGPTVVDSVPGPGEYSYTLIAIGEDGQRSAVSESLSVTVPPSDGTTTPPPPPEWNVVPGGFQTNFTAAGVAKHNDELWVVGGAAHGNAVRIFNPATGWRDGRNLPAGVSISHAALVSIGAQLYLLGGLVNEQPSRIVYRLDSPAGDWIEDSQLPGPRFAGAAAWDGERLVFAGGSETYSSTSRRAAADIWALKDGLWDPVAELSRAREHLAAVTDSAGTIWFVGGVDVERQEVYGNVDVLVGSDVSAGPTVDPPVQGAAAIWTPDTGICIFGGSPNLPNVDSSDVDPVDNVGCGVGGSGTDPNWPPLLEARTGAGATVVGNTVYVVGGFPGLTAEDMVLGLQFG